MRLSTCLSLLVSVVAGLTSLCCSAQDTASEQTPAHPYDILASSCPTPEFVCGTFSPGSTINTWCIAGGCKNYGRASNDHIAVSAERDSVNATNVLSRNWGIRFTSVFGEVIVLYNNCDVVSPSEYVKLNKMQSGRPDSDFTPQMIDVDTNTRQTPTLNLYTKENLFFGALSRACGMRLLIDGTRYDEHFSAGPQCLGWIECVNPTN